MRYQLWGEKGSKTAGILMEAEATRKQREFILGGLNAADMKMEFDADSWDEACQKQHEYNGWEDYVPPDDEAADGKVVSGE